MSADLCFVMIWWLTLLLSSKSSVIKLNAFDCTIKPGFLSFICFFFFFFLCVCVCVCV